MKLRFELVHCLFPSPSAARGKDERERKVEKGRAGINSKPRGWLLREVRRFGESKKYYIINTDPRVQWGRLCWCAPPPLSSSRSLLLSIFQATHPPLAKTPLFLRTTFSFSSSTLFRAHTNPREPFRRRGGTSGIYILII